MKQLTKIEQEIYDQVLVWLKNTQPITQESISQKIEQQVRDKGCANESFLNILARLKNRLSDNWKNSVEYELVMRKDIKSFLGIKRHFTATNMMRNGLIMFLPASLIIGILKEMGFAMGAFSLLFLFFLFILIGGKIRDFISVLRLHFRQKKNARLKNIINSKQIH